MKNIFSVILVTLLFCFTSFAQAQQMPEVSKVINTVKQTVNINQASLDDLILLKGIGVKRAKAIIAYREMNGKFASVDDLKKVSGIGTKVLDDNRQRLKI